MKLAKRLLVLVAAMAMVFTLTACGGSDFPKEYKYTEPFGQGEQVMTITLEEDGTYLFAFTATASNGSGDIVMDQSMTGTYTLDGDTLTLDTAEGSGYYTAGSSKTEFTITKDEPGMYVNTTSRGSFVFTIDGDTFVPAE